MKAEDLSKDPNERDVSILQALAAGQYAFGQYQTALDLLELASKLDPTDPTTYVMLSRIQYAIGEVGDALDWIDLAVENASDGLTLRDQVFERRIRLLGNLAGQKSAIG